MPDRLFIITGDPSGDVHAANVARELRKLQPDIEIAAVGGTSLNALGVELISDQSKMARIGFGSVLGAPYHYFLGQKILKFLDKFKPDAVLLIDYGVFNLWMAKQLKQRGLKVFYFIPPQVWGSRRGRLKKIKAFVDHVFCIFPFEEDFYRSHGIAVTYVGHPLVGQLPPPSDRTSFCKNHELDPDRPIVAVFPGSRKIEIDYLLKPIIGSIPLIRKQQPNAQFVIGKAAAIQSDYFQQRLQAASASLSESDRASLTILETNHAADNHALMSVADLAIAKSGTTTLELALYDTPMIIVYKLSAIVAFIIRRVAYLPYLGLPNILMGDFIVPEVLQEKANPVDISNALLPLFDPGSLENQKQKTGFQQIREKLRVGHSEDTTPVCVARALLARLDSQQGQRAGFR